MTADAMSTLRQANKAHLRAQGQTEVTERARDEAIRAAAGKGLPHTHIAKEVGLTAQRVGQIVAAGERQAA